MSSVSIALLALAGATSALVLPTSSAGQTSTRPVVTILSASGPACPSAADYGDGFQTRVSYALDVNGLSEFYQHVTYPFLAVDRNGPYLSRHCDITLEISTPKDSQILLHQNGTRQLATYDLDQGVTASWKYTYYTSETSPIVDTITVTGPLHTGNDEVVHSATTPAAPYTFPTCGDVALKLRAEVEVEGGVEGSKGRVDSQYQLYEHDSYKGPYQYGTSQGISLGAQKCAV